MWTYKRQRVNSYYPLVCEDLLQRGDVCYPRGLETKELHPTAVVITSPRQRLVTSLGRMINLPFALAEVVHILAGINDAQALKYYNSQIIKIQGDPIPDTETIDDWEEYVTRFNAAYGERLRRFEIGRKIHNNDPIVIDQLWHVIETLRRDSDSRQASIVLSHPGFDNVIQDTKDKACNVYAHVMIRKGKLDWMQVMRSNDIIWGLPYNFCQWLHIMEYVAERLGAELGTYTLVQDSLHVYADKYQECAEVREFDIYKTLSKHGYHILDMPAYDDSIFRENVTTWEEWIRTGGPTTLIQSKEEDANYWFQVCQVFNSYAAFKQHRDDLAWDLLPANKELRWPLLRNYMQWRWIKKGPEELVEIVHNELNSSLGKDVTDSWLGIPVQSS
jgi:thymidylate synthase